MAKLVPMAPNQHPATRGRNNAQVIIDQFGVKSAAEWLRKRMADTTKPALDPRYVEAYRAELNK